MLSFSGVFAFWGEEQTELLNVLTLTLHTATLTLTVP